MALGFAAAALAFAAVALRCPPSGSEPFPEAGFDSFHVCDEQGGSSVAGFKDV
jgi:hypothetical protein